MPKHAKKMSYKKKSATKKKMSYKSKDMDYGKGKKKMSYKKKGKKKTKTAGFSESNMKRDKAMAKVYS